MTGGHLSRFFRNESDGEAVEFLLDCNKWWTSFNGEIPSNTSSICSLTEEVIHWLVIIGWPEEVFFGIQLSLEEALINAFKHGNKFSPEKKVLFRCGISNDIVRFEITDEGDGFDPNLVSDPTIGDHLSKPNGRGVHLMRSFMNRVEYNSRGNSVFMEKYKD